jgi:dienelactone hydrolase
MMKFAMAVAALLGAATIVRADIRTQQVEYHDGDTVCEGFLAYDDANENLRPAVLIFPEWWGLTDYPKMRAVELAKLGYVAFVADVYGKGKTTEDPKQAGAWATPFLKDRSLLRRRCTAAMDTLTGQKYVDKEKVAAIGYCFGGACALELARSGAPLVGVVAFHGELSRTPVDGPDRIKGKVLICHGAADPIVTPKELADFEKEMQDAGADYQINIYGHAMHAFTNPAADQHHLPGIGYNAEADHRSWAAMRAFLDEVFGKAM